MTTETTETMPKPCRWFRSFSMVSDPPPKQRRNHRIFEKPKPRRNRDETRPKPSETVVRNHAPKPSKPLPKGRGELVSPLARAASRSEQAVAAPASLRLRCATPGRSVSARDASAVGRIEWLAEHLGTIPGDDAAILAKAFRRYLAGKNPIDAELGLKPTAAGEHDPRDTWRREQRNELIRAAGSAHFAHLRHTGRARALHKALDLYFNAAWHSDRHCPEQPHTTGTLRADLWLVLRCSPYPLTANSIRGILMAKPPFAPAADDDIEEPSTESVE
jgi:hypothetical protein